jgi:GT2 family glycosyltransferase
MTDRAGARVDATAVVVNHDDGAKLADRLDLLTSELEHVVVVDNASTDGSERAAEEREGVTLLRNEANLGFATAVNRGATLAEGAWIVLVNPDAFVRPGDIAALLEGLPDDVAVVAPLQVDERGTPKAETGGYDPTLLRYLVWAVLPTRLHGRWGPWLADPPQHGDTEVDWVSGALMGIRRRVFEQTGGLDERFFLYHEDVQLGRTVRRAGYRVLCRPSVRLVHEVSHGDPDRRIRQALLGLDSLAIDFDGWRRRALGLVLGLGFGLRALFASGTTNRLGRAALPSCGAMIAGRRPEAAARLRRPA